MIYVCICCSYEDYHLCFFSYFGYIICFFFYLFFLSFIVAQGLIWSYRFFNYSIVLMLQLFRVCLLPMILEVIHRHCCSNMELKILVCACTTTLFMSSSICSYTCTIWVKTECPCFAIWNYWLCNNFWCLALLTHLSSCPFVYKTHWPLCKWDDMLYIFRESVQVGQFTK